MTISALDIIKRQLENARTDLKEAGLEEEQNLRFAQAAKNRAESYQQLINEYEDIIAKATAYTATTQTQNSRPAKKRSQHGNNSHRNSKPKATSSMTPATNAGENSHPS